MAFPHRPPPAKMRPVRQQGRTFYLTALIVALFTCYSFLRDWSHADSQYSQRLALRSLEARDLEVCRQSSSPLPTTAPPQAKR